MNPMKYVNISLEIFGALLSLIIILNLIFAKYEKNASNRRFVGVLVCNIFVLLSDAIAWGFKGDSGAFSFYAVRIANFLVFTLGYLLLALYMDYLVCYISEKTKISRLPAQIMWIMCVIAVLLVVVSQFNNMFYSIDEQNVYHRESMFWLSQVWAIACMLIYAFLLVRFRKHLDRKEKIVLSSYILLPIAALVIAIFIYGIALLYIANSIAALCIYLSLQVARAQQYQQRELELEKSCMQITLSQIQPHFLSNALTAISSLCTEDPQKAQQALYNFSHYLRRNLDLLDNPGLVSFDAELSHLKNYLALEQMRFEERLHVTYHLQVTDFLLPVLTVQPIVENAVRHGVTKKREGGTVCIATAVRRNQIEITVSDDGVGFDTEQKIQDGRSHIGIENVRSRLALQCRGTLEVKSTPGKGTIVQVLIPKEAAQ